MAKASNNRRTTRRGAPKTIDLTAKEVKSAEAGGAEKDAAEGETGKTTVPPTEAVAFGRGASTKASPATNQPKSAASRSAGTTPDKASEKAPSKAPESSSAKPPEKPASKPSEKSAPPSKAPPPSQGPRRPGFGPILTGALAGAVVALLIAGGIAGTGLLAGGPDNTLTERADALEGRLSELEKANTDNSETTQLSSQVATLTSRLAQSEQKLEQLQQSVSNTTDNDRRLSELSTRVDDLSSQISSVRQEISQVQQAPTNGAPAADPAALSRLHARVSDLETANDGVSTDLKALKDRVSKVETTASDTAAQRATAEKKADAATLVAGKALTAAYDRGEPFLDLLDSLEDLVGETSAIDALRPYGETGVATDADIERGFRELAGKILSTSSPSEDGVINRLMANARSLIEVRPAGPVPGDTPPAIVSRVEADLDSGAFDKAYAEWKSLPEAAQQVSQGWADRLDARIAADKALNAVLSEFGLPANGSR